MTVQTYSLKVAGKGHQLSEHFTLGEFACHDGSDLVKVCPELIAVLEQIRAWAFDVIKRPAVVKITSGYRTHAYNHKIGGAAQSQHCEGIAADIQVGFWADDKKTELKFVKPETVLHALEDGSITGSRFVGGLGLYRSWLHVDVRGKQARWTG